MFQRFPEGPWLLLLSLDLNDGKNFTAMEWLMVFVKVPL